MSTRLCPNFFFYQFAVAENAFVINGMMIEKTSKQELLKDTILLSRFHFFVFLGGYRTKLTHVALIIAHEGE
jgi:hypothetical protein